ncbi:MAG: hypothetical protein KAR38_04710 [Calditrichia bacterium]|nr:hypothetical protein [Calditrichia bacterium]
MNNEQLSILTEIFNYYVNFRTALFTSSLMLGTFLFTMKSFIIQTMKKEVYDKDIYKDRVLQRRKEGKLKETYYGPLIKLKRILFVSICGAFINAFLQLVLGFFQNEYIAIICFLTTIVSWLIVAIAIYFVSNNISIMLNLSEEITKQELEGK